MFTPDQVKELTAPLNKAKVKTREQGKSVLSYVEAWHAIAEANRIFGFDAWSRETVELRQLGEPRIVKDKYGNDQIRVGYSARVRITVYAGDRVIVREGCGFGSGIDRDQDQAHESALKEAESDAMKRALMTFGNPFGLALYDKTQANVAADPPPPRDTSARDFAVKSLNSCKSQDDLKAIWTKNYRGWQDVMSAEDFAHVEKAKDALKITLPATVSNDMASALDDVRFA
jgi:DNA repair and recombination protein RAD52